MGTTTREFLAQATLSREMVDRFLDPQAPNWAVFDPELGYRLRDSRSRDGLDGSYTSAHYSPSGERTMLNYADQPCRINAYGDSFTQGHQVSNGETWEEYLAAHIGEPIRNLGVGGHGLYQAYRRMLREEKRQPAEYVILNIWSDDHVRSLYTWRWLHVVDFRQSFAEQFAGQQGAYMFHCNPWAHLHLNLDTGEFEEHENPYSTPESLYRLCDADHVYQAFKGDLDVQALLAQYQVSDVDVRLLTRAAEVLGLPSDFHSKEATAQTARALLQDCALRASLHVIDKALSFAQSDGKKILVLLTYGSGEVAGACAGRPRFDQGLLDYLRAAAIRFVDALDRHVLDYQSFRGTPEEYAGRHYIALLGHQGYGHYSPKGNHFFAFAIKDDLVDWLEPKPPAYRDRCCR